MAGWDGAGNFVRTHDWAADALGGIKILASRHDAEDDAFAVGLEACLARNGENVMTGTLDMNGQKIDLDVDNDSSFHMDTDDELDLELAGADVFKWTNALFRMTSAVALAAWELQSSEDGATIGPILNIRRNSATPADADFIGALYFSGEDDGDNETIYGSVEAQVDDVTGGEEDGTLLLKTMTAGTLTTQIDLSSALMNVTPPITSAGDVTGTTFAATGTTVAGDAASIGYHAGVGLRLTGQGTVSDVTMYNDANFKVLSIPTGTRNIHIGELGDSGATANLAADDLVLENATNCGMTIMSGVTSDGYIEFANSGSSNAGRIRYDHNTEEMSFLTNADTFLKTSLDGVVSLPDQSSIQKGLTSTLSNKTGNNTVYVFVWDLERSDVAGEMTTTTATLEADGNYNLSWCANPYNITTAADRMQLRIPTSNETYWHEERNVNDMGEHATMQLVVNADIDANDTVQFQIMGYGESSDVWDFIGGGYTHAGIAKTS